MKYIKVDSYNISEKTFSGRRDIRTIDCLNKEWANNSLDYAFSNCYNIYSFSNMNSNITSMSHTYENCMNISEQPFVSDVVTNMSHTFDGCTNLSGDIHINSLNVTNAEGCFANTYLDKNVYIPFQNNGVNALTFNSFINAGYSTTERVNGALLMDING